MRLVVYRIESPETPPVAALLPVTRFPPVEWPGEMSSTPVTTLPPPANMVLLCLVLVGCFLRCLPFPEKFGGTWFARRLYSGG